MEYQSMTDSQLCWYSVQQYISVICIYVGVWLRGLLPCECRTNLCADGLPLLLALPWQTGVLHFGLPLRSLPVWGRGPTAQL